MEINKLGYEETIDLTKATKHEVITAAVLAVHGVIGERIGETLESLEYYDSQEGDKYSVTLVEHYGGEGCGDTYYDVFKIQEVLNEHNCAYFKVSGYYSSYNGTDYCDDIYGSSALVKPVEKTIIVYEMV